METYIVNRPENVLEYLIVISNENYAQKYFLQVTAGIKDTKNVWKNKLKKLTSSENMKSLLNYSFFKSFRVFFLKF